MIQLSRATVEGLGIAESEVPLERGSSLGPLSTESKIDARLRRSARTIFHPAGSASTSRVENTGLRGCGVKNLRVVDVIVLPILFAVYYQPCVYAVAKETADITLND